MEAVDGAIDRRDVPVEQVKLMVQSLLADRFKLTSHTEQRGMKFLALILARPDGRLGPYIQQMGDDCTATSASEVVKKFPPRAATTSDGMMSGRCANITALAGLLGVEMEMPVVDQTGLSGKFVYEILGVTPNNSRVRIPPDSVPKWPSVPVALEEQLGLKLESVREFRLAPTGD